MIQLKVRQIGNSLGVVLPKEALQVLKVENGDNLFLTEAPGGELRVTAADPDFEQQMDVMQRGMRKYRNALRELAK